MRALIAFSDYILQFGGHVKTKERQQSMMNTTYKKDNMGAIYKPKRLFQTDKKRK